MNKFLGMINKKYCLILSIFICIIYFFNYEKSLSYNYKDSYAFSELFLNYQGGFVRRGLLGEIFIILHKNLSLSPIIFFSSILFLTHLATLFLFFKIIENIKLPYELNFILFFSPALLFFSIYDFNMFFVKDIFIKFLILLHALIVIKTKKNLKKYLYYFKFLIIPLIILINLFIHEYGILFISIHLLFSLYAFEYKKKYFFFIYGILLLFLILIIFINIGNENILNQINQSIQSFGVSVHKQLSGGFKSLIGGFYKWHFFYFGYKDFLMLFFSFLLSIWIFYFFFHILIIKKILIYNFKYNYILFFFPTFLVFLNLDHGRNLSLLSFHLVAFYLILNVNFDKLKKFIIKKRNNFYFLNFLYLFIFFYVFMWILPQDAGFGGKEQLNSIFRSSLFKVIKDFINYLYIFISNYLITFPEIRL
jgi:hypothetical protein